MRLRKAIKMSNLFLEYKEELIHSNRFFPDKKFERLFQTILENGDSIVTIPSGTTLYRARNNKGREFYNVSDLRTNKEKNTINRASPAGIPYIYLASSPKIALAEIKAHVGTNVSTVAMFKTIKNLRIMFLRNFASCEGQDGDEFDPLDVSNFILYLSHSFAAPVDRNEAETEYLPAQYFAEYCKKNGLDGIKYVSSSVGLANECNSKNPYNYVLFDDNNVEYVEAHKYSVKRIDYKVIKEDVVELK